MVEPTAANKTAEQKQATPAKSETGAPMRRSFFVDEGGVFLIDVREGAYLPPKWVCSRLDVLAKVRSPDNRGWGLLVALSDPDRVQHRIIIPMALFNGEGLEVAGLLLDRGLNLAPRARPALVEYLQTAEAKARARITGRTGWHDGGGQSVFVLPTMAFGEGAEQWIFETGEPGGNTFKQHGTLEEWKLQVSSLCRGNSRLLFAVSTAFASPLLHLAGAESGGIHYRSNSSDGKTTALRVAASVCGAPDYMQRWRATDNGLEALAMQHCDAPLLLDELAQLDPRAAGEVAYMLANGSGKARAARTGGARERASWRLLFLSAGEIGLVEHMGEAGKTPRAGQELRLAEIPADAGAGLGVFENLHGHSNGSEFAKALDAATRKHYGTALVALLDKLAQHQADIPGSLKEAQKQFEKSFLTLEAGGQAHRVAGRFALVGAAGELATGWGITGWEPGEAMQAAGLCFKAWLSNRGGEGNREEKVMLAKVREFLERHGEARFADFGRPVAEDDHAPRVINKAGFRKHLDGLTEYFIYPEVFKAEVCKGFDYKVVAKLLAVAGYIKLDGKRPDPKVTLPGEGQKRVFHVLPTIWGDDDA